MPARKSSTVARSGAKTRRAPRRTSSSARSQVMASLSEPEEPATAEPEMPHIALVSELSSPTFGASDPEPETVEPAPAPTIESRYNACVNCAHMPMGVNSLVGVLVALIFTLSSLLVASSMVIDSQAFQIKAFNGAANVGSVAQR